MGRASTRQNKTPYQLAREELGLSRERAAELLETIPAERIERIESERSLPRPDEVLRMAQRYKKPSLCNAYCARACPIGQEYVPEIKPKELPAIGLARYGGSTEEAMAGYGTIHGMVFPILMFPAAILYSVSDLLVPELSRCRAMGRALRVRDLSGKCIRMTMLF